MNLITSLIFLSSGLFLGWSLGANDASNVFGSAVGSRMVRFSTAALLCSIFVIIGAVTAGAGAADGLGELGSVNALAGSFTTAMAAAVTVFWMTRMSLPVSTTQAVVGAIVGWNWFSGSITDINQLMKIFGTWVFCPILAALFSATLYFLIVKLIKQRKPHLLTLDANIRIGLILAGIFGSYTLGANNIGNVMGVFVTSSPFEDVTFADLFNISAVQQLFLLGAIAIAVGVFTYSKKVMMTVGGSLMTLSPLGALVVVMANSLVLFVFSSKSLSNFVVNLGLPPIPLIPVSSSQAVVGAVIGIGLLQGVKGIRQIRWGVLGGIASGWITTPIIAALIGFTLLFFVQNVFSQQVYQEVYYQLSPSVIQRLADNGINTTNLSIQPQPMAKAVRFRQYLKENTSLKPDQANFAIESAEIFPMKITKDKINQLKQEKSLNAVQFKSIKQLKGASFDHRWQLTEALQEKNNIWRRRSDTADNKQFNQELKLKLLFLERFFHTTPSIEAY